MIQIPPSALDADILTHLLEEFVTRDGTDSADAPAKVAQVRKLLRDGTAVILFDEESETTTIRMRDDFDLK